MKGQRTYTKQNLEKELLEENVPLQRNEYLEKSVIELKPIETFSNYQKTSKELPTKTFIVIISCGEKREKDYFKIIKGNRTHFQRIKLEFYANTDTQTIEGLFEYAKSKKTHYLTSQVEGEDEPDKIFLLSDVDHFINDLIKFKPQCEQENLRLIISNCSFEVWLYYAYYKKKPDFKIPSDRLKTSSQFKTWVAEQVNGGLNPVKAFFDIEQNISNAEANYAEDENGIPILFATNMFVLGKELLPFVLQEVKEMVEMNAKRRENALK